MSYQIIIPWDRGSGMVSVRPTSVRKLKKILETLKKLGSDTYVNLNILSKHLGISENHIAELIQFLKEMGLVEKRGNYVALSDDGFKFIDAVYRRDIRFLDNLFSRLPGYSAVARCIESGRKRPSEIATCAQVSTFRADILSRLYRELKQLTVHEASPSITQNHGLFEAELFKAYGELSRSKRSKYVLLSELLHRVSCDLNIDVNTAVELLASVTKKYSGRIVLVKAPATLNTPVVVVGGKAYTHIAVF